MKHLKYLPLLSFALLANGGISLANNKSEVPADLSINYVELSSHVPSNIKIIHSVYLPEDSVESGMRTVRLKVLEMTPNPNGGGRIIARLFDIEKDFPIDHPIHTLLNRNHVSVASVASGAAGGMAK